MFTAYLLTTPFFFFEIIGYLLITWPFLEQVLWNPLLGDFFVLAKLSTIEG